jgi:hypothetical protein
VAERVVHVLEVVEIDEQHREALARAPRPMDLEIDAVERHHPVGQPGQRVEVRLAVKLRLLLLDLLGHRVEGLRELPELVGRLHLHRGVPAAADLARGGDEPADRLEHVEAERRVDGGAEEQHDRAHHQRLDEELPAQLVLQRLAAQADQEAAQQDVVVRDGELELDQLVRALALLHELRGLDGAALARAVLDERLGGVDVKADRHALRAHDDAVDHIGLRRHLAGVVVEQQVIEAEDRFGADERDQPSERAAALEKLLLVEAAGGAEEVQRIRRHGADEDRQDGERELCAQSQPHQRCPAFHAIGAGNDIGLS